MSWDVVGMEAGIASLPRSTVVVPTYNEAKNIERLVETVLGLSPDLSLLIIDDSSPDGTGEIALGIAQNEERLELLRRPRKMGLGSAYREGFAHVLRRGGSAYVLEMDADFSHDPGAVPALIETAERTGADLVIGSRYVSGGRIAGWGRMRLLLSSTANRFCSLILGGRLKDYTAGFRCYRADSLETIGFSSVRSEGYAFQVEMAFRALRKGLKLTEVPIVFSERRAGVSKFGAAIFIEAAFVLGLLFLRRLVL